MTHIEQVNSNSFGSRVIFYVGRNKTHVKKRTIDFLSNEDLAEKYKIDYYHAKTSLLSQQDYNEHGHGATTRYQRGAGDNDIKVKLRNHFALIKYNFLYQMS